MIPRDKLKIMSLSSTPLYMSVMNGGDATSVNEIYSGSTVRGGASEEIVRALILQDAKAASE